MISYHSYYSCKKLLLAKHANTCFNESGSGLLGSIANPIAISSNLSLFISFMVARINKKGAVKHLSYLGYRSFI